MTGVSPRNSPHNRRLALAEGQAADAPAAWLEVAADTLVVLPQRYQRRAEATYWYEAPSVHYAALLEVTPVRFRVGTSRLADVAVGLEWTV